MLASADRIAYVSQGAREHLQLIGFEDSRLFRLPYTARRRTLCCSIRDAEHDRDERREVLGFKADDRVFIAVTKLNAREGLPTLLDGFLEASRQAPNLRLLLVGGGPLEGLVKSHASSSVIPPFG